MAQVITKNGIMVTPIEIHWVELLFCPKPLVATEKAQKPLFWGFIWVIWAYTNRLEGREWTWARIK